MAELYHEKGIGSERSNKTEVSQREKNDSKSAGGSSADRESQSASIRSMSKDIPGHEGVWSAIDTLDDIRKMAKESKNKDAFPIDFEENLNKSRDVNAKLLNLIRDRSQRVEKNIRVNRANNMNEEENRDKNDNEKKQEDKSGTRREGRRGLDKTVANMKTESTTSKNEFLYVNLNEHNIYSSSDDELSDPPYSDTSNVADPTASRRRLSDNGPIYISDYTDYQANIRQITSDERAYVLALEDTIRASTAPTLPPKENTDVHNDIN